MKLRLIRLRDSLADSFWFVPTVMAFMAMVASFGLIAIDRAIDAAWIKNIAFVWTGGPDGARSVLSVIAGSVMTVISIVFSLTIAALATTSSHYGPRVLRNFTSDRGVQMTLGTFIATFVYCLLVLRTVRSVQETAFVPYLAVTFGFALALASLAVLIYFIHHIAQMIQTDNLIATIAVDLNLAFTTLFPEEIGETQRPELPLEPNHWQHARAIFARENGYVQRVDEDAVMTIAAQHDLQIKLERRPGDFVSRRGLILSAQPVDRLTEAIETELGGCVAIGTRRTPHQDPRYSLQQLVEIAAHALSPGINEPFTAMGCLDWIGSALRSVAGRTLPTAQRFDGEGDLRVLARPVTFQELAADAFDEIRIYGANNPDVLKSLLLAIRQIAPGLRRAADREVLLRHIQNVVADSERINNAADRQGIVAYAEETVRMLNATPVAG